MNCVDMSKRDGILGKGVLVGGMVSWLVGSE